jgi:hypothetical protein
MFRNCEQTLFILDLFLKIVIIFYVNCAVLKADYDVSFLTTLKMSVFSYVLNLILCKK